VQRAFATGLCRAGTPLAKGLVYNGFFIFYSYFGFAMPIYEYRCNSCGFQKEYIQRMSDALLTDCPECNKPTFNKMVTAAGFQLKGGGWYVTDFKGGGNTAGAKKSDEKQTDASKKPGSGSAESSAPSAAPSTPPTTAGAPASSTPVSSSGST